MSAQRGKEGNEERAVGAQREPIDSTKNLRNFIVIDAFDMGSDREDPERQSEV